jgi:ubiquitin-activating enzyme E1
MGIDAVSKQAKASVFIMGLGPFALEVAKNIVLSGCKRLTFYDAAELKLSDLSGGFFYTEADLGKKRTQAIIHKIQELNQYVRVDVLQEFDITKLKGYDIVLVTETSFETQLHINKFTRENGIKFISADCMGPYSRLFNDFGSKFEVLDKNGEEPTEVMIKNISFAENGVVTLLDGAKHPY